MPDYFRNFPKFGNNKQTKQMILRCELFRTFYSQKKISNFVILNFVLPSFFIWSTGGPHYMRTFCLQFHVYAIKIMAFLRDVSSYLPMLLVSLYGNSLCANHFFRSLSIAYNEVHLYCIFFTHQKCLFSCEWNHSGLLFLFDVERWLKKREIGW